jgi:hypothetical protein
MVAVGLLSTVAPAVAVELGSDVAVRVGVEEVSGAAVPVEVGVALGVSVPVPVGVGLAVALASVAFGVGVAVAEEMGGAVASEVAVGVSVSTAAPLRLSPRAIMVAVAVLGGSAGARARPARSGVPATSRSANNTIAASDPGRLGETVERPLTGFPPLVEDPPSLEALGHIPGASGPIRLHHREAGPVGDALLEFERS